MATTNRAERIVKATQLDPKKLFAIQDEICQMARESDIEALAERTGIQPFLLRNLDLLTENPAGIKRLGRVAIALDIPVEKFGKVIDISV